MTASWLSGTCLEPTPRCSARAPLRAQRPRIERAAPNTLSAPLTAPRSTALPAAPPLPAASAAPAAALRGRRGRRRAPHPLLLAQSAGTGPPTRVQGIDAPRRCAWLCARRHRAREGGTGTAPRARAPARAPACVPLHCRASSDCAPCRTASRATLKAGARHQAPSHPPRARISPGRGRAVWLQTAQIRPV